MTTIGITMKRYRNIVVFPPLHVYTYLILIIILKNEHFHLISQQVVIFIIVIRKGLFLALPDR